MTGLIAFEDEHLLVVRKPPGINTHAAAPHAGEGIYDWLRRRESRWADLAIIQRLDKETSGLLLFSKSRRGNVSLTKQFSRRRVSKEYLLWTDRRPPQSDFAARSWIRKGAGRFENVTEEGGGLEAETKFTLLEEVGPGRWSVRAEPLTGRSHQIRVHAAAHGFPILGDTLYGGSSFPRLCLHATRLRLRHPATNEQLEFADTPDFNQTPSLRLRSAVVDFSNTDAFRVCHGAADGFPGWYVDRLGDRLLASSTLPPEEAPDEVPDWLMRLRTEYGARAIYLRNLHRHIRQAAPETVAPARIRGEDDDGEFLIRENGMRFWINLGEGYSSGLFLDQRDNRRRLLVNWIGPRFPVAEPSLAGRSVLNVFAYTCGFSVAAAEAGAKVTSLDLSRRYLEWGKRNFTANDLRPEDHDFIYGDAFEWLRRLAKKGRKFDVVLLDPPTFSQSREHGIFRAETDYAALVTLAGSVLSRPGVLFASTNAARLEPEAFLGSVRQGLREARVEQELFVPQPPDFPTSRDEPAYLKTVWLRVGS